MKKICSIILFLGCLLTVYFPAPKSHAAQTGTVIVGVNSWYKPPNVSSEAMIEQLAKNHVKTIRIALYPASVDYIIQAYQHGVGSIVWVSPYGGTTVKSKGSWSQYPLSQLKPEEFAVWFKPLLDKLDAAGVRLTAIEFGNEINTSFYNGDVPDAGSGRILGISDLQNPNDLEASTIATGYKTYLKVLAAAKDLRDHSQVNKSTPLILAGMANEGSPSSLISNKKPVAVSLTDTIEFFRQNGADQLVAGYGVHVYPGLAPNRSVETRIASLGHDIFAACTPEKPCWLTEWGVPDGSPNSASEHCPIDETNRTKVIGELRGAFRHFVNEGRLAAVIFYDWADQPGNTGAIFRCGTLTDAGKLALSPM